MSAGPTGKQLQHFKRRMAHKVRILANEAGYAANIYRAKPKPKNCRGDGYGPVVDIVRPESERVIGSVRCTSIHASNGEASGYFMAYRASDGICKGSIDIKEAVRFALGPEYARKTAP
jgi:hypothetical protein